LANRKNRPPRSRAERWRQSGTEADAGGRWYISGWNGVRECLASPHVGLARLWADPARLTPELWELIRPCQRVLIELKGRETPFGEALQGVAALVDPPNWPDIDDLLDQIMQTERAPLFVALDQVEDPMNLGQILRSCEGAGVDAVLVPGRRAAHLNQTAAQISQGAFAWLPIVEVGNLRQALERLRGRGLWTVGCDADSRARLWRDCSLAEPSVLVFGAEGRGLRELTRKTCDVLARLPMGGRIPSLNVSAAVAAFVYEAARQRLTDGGDAAHAPV